MEDRRRVNYWTFNWNEDCNCYEARGSVMYDYEHDEIPEPSLWDAAKKLADDLKKEGIDAQAEWSEKGWVEVIVTDKNKKA